MNYVQLFANGGKTSDKDLIKGIQQILGVDDTQMEQLLQIGINKYGSLEGIGQALNEATQGLTPESSPEEVQAAVASVFSTNEPSQMFKCGGKLQQLVTKFGKGGGVDCGCGGKKLQPGGRAPKVLQGSTPTRSAALAGLRTVRVPDLENVKNRKVGAVRDNEGGLHLFEDAVVNGSSAQTAVNIHPGDTVITQNVLRRAGWDPRKYVRGDDQYELIMQRMRPFINGVPYKQEGGSVNYEEMPGYDVDTRLTRRQARELARVNGMSENNEQFSFAMANAMNAARAMGLRGAEARQRAREMAAGIKPTERSIVNTPTQLNVSAPILNAPAAITAPEQLTLPETQRNLDSLLEQTNKNLVSSLNKPVVPSQKTGVSQNRSNNALANQQRRYLNDIAERATANPEWFWGDDESANQARAYLYNLNGGSNLIQQIYDNTPEALQQNINYKKLPHNISANRTIANQQARTEQAGRNVAKGAAVLAGSLAAAEALPYIINGVPEYLNFVKGAAKDFARSGYSTYPSMQPFSTFPSPNGASIVTSIKPGVFGANAAVNGLANPMVFPIGFKCGGKVESAKFGCKTKAECGVKLKPSMKCGGKTKKKK